MPFQRRVSNPSMPNPSMPNPSIPNPSIPNPSIPNPSMPNPSTRNPSWTNVSTRSGGSVPRVEYGSFGLQTMLRHMLRRGRPQDDVFV